MKTLVHWFLSALAVMVTAYLLPGIVVQSFFVALVVAVMLGLLNTFIRPLLVLIAFPLEIITLGLFTVVINAALVLLTARFVAGFSVSSFWTALFFSIILSLVNAILHLFEPSKGHHASPEEN